MNNCDADRQAYDRHHCCFEAGECITALNLLDKMAADQQFCLRWNNHQSTLIQVFDTLLASEQLVDCTLAAEGQYLKAHKVVLSACSPYLELLLAQHYEKHPIVILKDVKFQELKSMMDYMYRGEVNISQDQLSTFLKAAESLQIKGLTDSGEDSRDVGSTKRVDGAAQGARKAAAATGAAAAASSGSNRASPAVGGSGLTIEARPASPHHRDASLSPTPRKRRRARRPSQGDAPDSHNDTSNSCDLPPASALAPPEHIETEHINNRLQNSNNMELIKEKVEPTPELMIEPKTEYMDENNEDSVEDLTLDDDDDLDMNRSGMDMGRPGPSHGDSNQGFATSWHMQGDRSGTDEVFMAAQEAVGAAHRDSQAGKPPNIPKPQRFRIEASDNDQVTLVKVDEGSVDDSLDLSLVSSEVSEKESRRDWPTSSFQDQSGSRIVLCRRPKTASSTQEKQESYRYAGASSYWRLLDFYSRQSGTNNRQSGTSFDCQQGGTDNRQTGPSFDNRVANPQSQGDNPMPQSGPPGFSAFLDNAIKVRNVAELNNSVEASCSAVVKQEPEYEHDCPSPSLSQSSSLLLGEEAASSADFRRSMQIRRREQNKYATQRYRMRKKWEVDNIFREEQDLVNRNRQLKHRVLCLVAEVARLKVCLRTRLHASGVPAPAITTLLGSKKSDDPNT